MLELPGAERIASRLRRASGPHGPAIVAFLTAGYPTPERFRELLVRIARSADVVEVGVPFTDPMADGVTIQRASRVALEHGTTLAGILDELQQVSGRLEAPVLLMSYLNPLLALGLQQLGGRARAADVCGLIVPDLPLEESEPLHETLREAGLALVQLVSPVSSPDRMRRICAASEGFVYAVTSTGVTGGRGPDDASLAGYLKRVRDASPVPVCAGFGIRERAQVSALAPHVEGVIVGSALIESLDRGEDPVEFLTGLRGERP